MLLAVIAAQALLSGSQHLTPRELDSLTKTYADQWRCDEDGGGRGLVPLVPPVAVNVPSPSRVLSANGDYSEPEFLAAVFQPFWLPGGAKPGQRVRFRRGINLPGEVASCSVILSADDDYRLSVNDIDVSSGSDLVRVNREIPITKLIHEGGLNFMDLRVHNQTGPAFARCRIEAEVGFPVRDLHRTEWQILCGRTWLPALVVKSPVFSNKNGESIWASGLGDGVQKCEFRRLITFDGIPLKSDVLIGADDAWQLWVNGKMMGYQGMSSNPAPPRHVDVSSQIHTGANTIIVKVWNYGGPGALFCVPTIRYTF